MIYQYKEWIPVIDESAFIHPQATVTGNVIIGKDVYIGPGAAIRGDYGKIIIEDGCNVQENCTIHMFPGVTVLLKKNAHIGHGAIIHGSTIGQNCLIGMNAVIMDNVILGDECIVGALCFIKADEIIPNRSVVVGNPAKIIKSVSDEMLQWKTEGTHIYQQLAREMPEIWKECTPLRKIPQQQTINESKYQPWNNSKKP
jgi:carbonic anhydrase/acetyltransferase-like protein (isoleucine patch superfamily)